jgi:GGDEF domain-containing protein
MPRIPMEALRRYDFQRKGDVALVLLSIVFLFMLMTHGDEPQDHLIHQADQAMVRATNSGRDRTQRSGHGPLRSTDKETDQLPPSV